MTKVKVEFVPGCFDDFEGTQEELDSLMQEIIRMAESGELQEISKPLDDPDVLEQIGDVVISPRTLN